MKLIFLIAAVCQVALGSHGGPHPETCTEVDVQGDGTASCQCYCECEVDCMTGCHAGEEGPNVLIGYAGGQFDMNSNNKFLASSWGMGSDQCKFQVRIDTEDDDNDNPQVGWAGFAFGVHQKNDAKFERNFRISLKQGEVEKRGRGYNPTPVAGNECIESGPWPEPWTFCVVDNGNGCWTFTATGPGGCEVVVEYCEANTEGNALNNDVIWITPNDYYWGKHLRGMCDTFDGSGDVDCSGVDPGPEAQCIDGDHQNNG